VVSVPPAIPQWDGWFYPSNEDLTHLWYFMEGEERGGITSLDSNNWLWVGESPLVPHIRHTVPSAQDELPPVLPPVAGSLTGPGTASELCDATSNWVASVAMELETLGQGTGDNMPVPTVLGRHGVATGETTTVEPGELDELMDAPEMEPPPLA
jgi:hypothetical protein